MSTRHYTLNCGQYVLADGEGPISAPLDEIALAFDTTDGALYKHGDPKSVEKWFADKRAALIAADLGDWAGNLTLLTGRFPLDELNRCLTTTGYVLTLYERAQSGALAPQPLADQAPGVLRAPRNGRP